MPIPINFRRSTERVLASFSFTDIASGTGFVPFYLCQENSGGTESPILAESTSVHAHQVTFAGDGDKDYDSVPFNLPRTVRGTAYINIFVQAGGGDTMTVSVQLRKWDGTTETNLHTAVSDSITADAVESFLFVADLTETNFKKGDMLRLNVTTTNGSVSSRYGTDPAGRDSAGLTAAAGMSTRSTVFVPFRIDV